METSEDHESTERIHEIKRRYDEFEKRFTGKHEAAANEKAAHDDDATQREDLAGEAEQQHTVLTALHRAETIDSKDQEL